MSNIMHAWTPNCRVFEVGGRGDRQQTETVRWADQQPVEAVRWADPPLLPQAGGSSCNSSQTLPIGNQVFVIR